MKKVITLSFALLLAALLIGASCPEAQDTGLDDKPAKEKKEKRQKVRRFSGNGGKDLGTIKITSDAELRWTNSGDLFTLMDDGVGLFVNSQASSGNTAVSPGTYENVRVNAIGDWKVTIRPR